jgi:ligand-binding SRPBCC domain-containing protein
MPIIRIDTDITAPPSRCFDLARSIDAHVASATGTGERAVAGKTSGLLGLDDEVTWQARHLGVTQKLSSRIAAFDRPNHFQDVLVRGAFARLIHDHYFTATPTGTRMQEVFDYAAPLGLFGRVAEALVLTRHLTRFLRQRADVLKELAESDGWRQFVDE